VIARGTHFNPLKKIQTADQEMPIATRPLPRHMLPKDDLTGRMVGLLSVLGMARDTNGRWVVRCVCGIYSLRNAKAIKNSENTQDRCELCRYKAFLKRDDHFRRTGRDSDITSY